MLDIAACYCRASLGSGGAIQWASPSGAGLFDGSRLLFANYPFGIIDVLKMRIAASMLHCPNARAFCPKRPYECGELAAPFVDRWCFCGSDQLTRAIMPDTDIVAMYPIPCHHHLSHGRNGQSPLCTLQRVGQDKRKGATMAPEGIDSRRVKYERNHPSRYHTKIQPALGSSSTHRHKS